jgi:hypothetical protein
MAASSCISLQAVERVLTAAQNMRTMQDAGVLAWETGPGAPCPYVAGSAQDNPVVPSLLDADKALVVALLNPLFTTQQTTNFKGPAR